MPELGIGLGIHKGGVPKKSLLLDKYDIDAAFSLRKVRADYNGPCVRVRNSSGEFADIGFTSKGVLDEAALNAHCGENDGTVQTWYNQSTEGGRFNAVQDTPANQPIIYDASEGGYLGYVENTGDMYLRFENQLAGVTDLAVVYEKAGGLATPASGSAYVLGEHSASSSGKGVTVDHSATFPGFTIFPGSGNGVVSHTGAGAGVKHSGFVYFGGDDDFLVVDGYVCAEATSAVTAPSLDYIFTKANSGGSQDSFDFVGKVWEVFLSTSDLSAKRIALENSILSANGLTVPEQTLLEKYDGAAAAYSLRSVNREHVGPIVEVRGNSTEGVYLNSNGVVNEDRIAALCTGVDGFVRTWYDQSGNGRHQVQATNASQPKIYDGTDKFYYTEDNVAIWFNDQGMEDSSDNQITVLDQSVFVVAEMRATAPQDRVVFVGHSEDGVYQVYAAQVWGGADNSTADEMINYAGNAQADRVTLPLALDVKQNLRTYGWHHDSDTIFQYNGEEYTPDDNAVLAPTQSTYQISVGSKSYNPLNAYVTEVIVYEGMRDATTRTNIEKNQNEHFLVHQVASTTPSSGFLADYSGAAAAYSVRQLGDANLCMKVRRSGDSATKNIGFGSDGFVDTTAISDFCGSDDGFVVTWFDQSGNDQDATQGTPGSQPKIYDGTDGVEKENGIPTINFDGGNYYLKVDGYIVELSQNSASVFAVANGGTPNTQTDYLLSEGDAASPYSSNFIFGGANTGGSGVVLWVNTTSFGTITDGQHVIGFDYDGTNFQAHLDGDTAGSSGTATVNSETVGGGTYIGSRADGTDGFYDGNIQEIITYKSDKSSDRSDIESNINDAFDIYPSTETPTSGFLGEFSGAAAAYSVRKLGDSPVAMRVRKTVSAVDYYQVIGFDANGDLDTAAIEEFADGNDVFVQTWYDQSGNGNHATQNTAANQPKIYDGTDGVVLENGKPIIEGLANGGLDVTLSPTQAFTVSAVSGSNHNPVGVLFGEGARMYQGSTTYLFADNFMNASIDTSNQQSLFFGEFNGASSKISVNTAVDSSVVTGDAGTATSITCLLNRSTSRTNYSSLHEFVLWDTGQDSAGNRTDIESNINDYYSIYQEASASPATGLLSEAPNAAAAYSVRQLGDAKLCMKVRRGSDGATKNIGFVRGVVDTAAIEAFCGNSDGTVAVWYDQSGSGNHATQGTISQQPKIYDNATGIEKDNNGNITTRFITDGYTLDSEIFLKSDDPDRFLISFVADIDDSDNVGEYFAGVTASSFNFFENNGAASYYKLRHTTEANTGNVNSIFTEPDPAPTSDKIASFLLYSESDEKKLKLNGTQLTSSGGTGWTDSNNYKINIGKLGRGYSSELNNSMYSEFVVWENYADGDVEKVGDNVNKHYKTQTAFTTGLLDSYPGAAAAYSLRRLSSTYTGPAIEVTSNGSTQDIGFDIEGNLDTSALAAFCGSNDGTVSKWYDQSGGGNDAAQTTLANQPKIYDGTDGVVLENGKPAVEFDGTNDNLTSSLISSSTEVSIVAVHKNPNRTGYDAIIGVGDEDGYALTTQNSKYNLFYRTVADQATTTDAPNDIQSLIFAYTKSSDSQVLHSNGAEIQSITPATMIPPTTGSSIGAYDVGSSAEKYGGLIQEIVLYSSDQSSNRSGIEKNINKHYSIYDQPLLDVVPDAAAAYSLRKLRADYTGPAINVYNGTDYKDIYFRRDGSLDTAAIAKFCGSNDGTVAIWYDQSGNANHAEQTTVASQPKIYDGTDGLLTENGKPALDFDGANDYLQTTYDNPTNNYTAFWVQVPTSGVGSQVIGRGDSLQRHVAGWSQTGAFLYRGGTEDVNLSGSASQYLGYALNKGSSVDCRVGYNGTTSTSATNIGTSALEDMVIGAERSSSFLYGDSSIQEVVLYPSDQSSNRTVAEANINHYYGIY